MTQRATTSTMAAIFLADAARKRARRADRKASEGRIAYDTARWAAVQRRYQERRGER